MARTTTSRKTAAARTAATALTLTGSKRGTSVVGRVGAREKGREVAKLAERIKVRSAADQRPLLRLAEPYYEEEMPSSPVPLNRIVNADSVDYLNAQPEGWADLAFADPPFNIGYLYHNYEDRKDVDEYVNWSEQWISAVYRALKPGGSFYLAIGDEFAADLCVLARRKVGFHLRNWIIWHYTFGQQTRKMFAKSHTHILYFTKEKPNAGMSNITFNADAVRVKSARQTVYGDDRANPKGKLPDDTWFLRPQEASLFEPSYRTLVEGMSDPIDFFDPRSDTWNVSRVCGTFKEREGWHGCQMPIAVLDRIIKASSNPGDVVLDPFSGSGTTAASAALLGRNYVGIDQSAEYVKFAQARLAHALASKPKNGELAGKGTSDHVFNIDRASRVKTETDAFGRPRVARNGRRAGARADSSTKGPLSA